MIFGVIVLALVAVIAFFHYVQGLFSAMVSAVLVIIAALVAVSYHEELAESLFANTFPSYAHAVALVGLFGAVYLVLRLVCDALVSGNVRLPLLVDKIGAGVFGLIAGIFAAGIFVLAAQLLPFGPDIAGYSRFALANREITNVTVPKMRQKQDVAITGELKNDSLSPTQASGMFVIPADDMVLSLVHYVSNGGSLAGERPLSAIHPSYLDELFGHRLGPLLGSDVLISGGKQAGMTVQAAYSSDQVIRNIVDFELKNIRGETALATLDSGIPLVIRASIDAPTSGARNAFNMASIRLVLNGRDYYPVGSYQDGKLYRTRLDDYLFVDGQNAVDFVFMVESELLPVKEGGNARTFPAGTFIAARRAARVDLSSMAIGNSIPNSSAPVGIMMKDPATQR